MGYKHLSKEQRYAISVELQNEKPISLTAIAEKIGVHKSTVSRELRRNSDGRGHHKYDCDLAQRKAEKRSKGRAHARKFNDEMKREAYRYIVCMEYSPEQVTGRCRLEGVDMVSHETLYQWIWDEKRRGDPELSRHLRRRGRKYAKRGSEHRSRGIIKDRVGIDKRPKVVDEKSRIGDMEMDTVIGRNHKGAIMTANDRVSKMVFIRRLDGKEASPLAAAAVEALGPYKRWLHTITSDNGKEFAGHKEIAEKLGVDFFFARPYHSWERGANENTNGLIRQYIPKGTDFSTLTDEFIALVECKLNNRPRKSLGFLTPLEYFKKNCTFAPDKVALKT